MDNKPKKIDIWHNILWSKYKGGVFSALYNTASPDEFDLRFFQIAQTSGDRKGLSSVDTSYHTYPYKLLFKGSIDEIGFAKRFCTITRHTWRSDADLFVLTGYEKPETWAQILLIKLKRKKLILFCDSTINDQPQNKIKAIAKKIIFGMADGIFGYGERAKEYALSFGVKPENWHQRCQAAALPSDYDPHKALQLRSKKISELNNSPRYLYVGRLSPEKNLLRLLEAFSIVKNQNPSSELVIIGGGHHLEELKQKATELGLNPDNIFKGSKSRQDLYDEYAKASCSVLPSTSEPWGLVVNEVLHYGCPVVVSNLCGCVPELVIEGKTGFVHDPYNVQDLADKMLLALSKFNNPNKTAELCIDHMKNYMPETAAEQMITGFKTVFSML
ncbi:MAG: glycosyltransferase [Alphaproteobacteria bacterium]